MVRPQPSTWTETKHSLAGCQVVIAVEQVPRAMRDAVATSMVWLALDSASPRADHAGAWKALAENVLGAHVAFRVDHPDPDALGPAWWGEALQHATSAFIHVNELGPLIARALSLPAHAVRGSLQ